jgi:gliding motility-associated-like protein
MKTTLLLSRNTLSQAAFAVKLLIISFPLAGSGNSIYAGIKPAVRHILGYNTNIVKKIDSVEGYFIKRALPKFPPLTISYNGPQTYMAGINIKPLSPISTGVGALAYNNVPVTISNAFGGPRGLTLDAAGNIYVADYFSGVIKKFPVGGGAPVILGSGFAHPMAVAVDAAGNVYVADINNTNIMKIPFGGGVPVVVATGFSNPFGIAIDAAGNLYVADFGNKAVKMIPVGGVPVIISSGFTSLASVAVDAAGNVYAGDSGTHAVYKIPADGSARVVIGIGPNAPNAITVDGAGNVYVVDGTNNVVNKFPVGGGAPVLIGSGPGIMIGVAIDPTGVLYVTDYSNKALQKITPIGGYHINAALPAGLNFDEATGIISGAATGSSPATDYIITAYNGLGSTSATVNIKVKALDINYGSPKTYITATPIAPLAPVSAGVAAAGYTASPVSVGSGFSRPRNLAIDAIGNIYIADYQSNTIKKMPAGGGLPVIIGSGFSGPSGVAVDAAGNVYVADYLSNLVKKIPAGGGATVNVGSGFLHPNGVAVDGAGNIFVVDNGNHAMKEIPAGGGAVINLGTYTNPLAVTTDARGNVYFSEKSNGVIYKIPVEGGPAIIIASGVSNPLGLAVDAMGNLFIADGVLTTLLELPVLGNTLVPIGSGFNIPAGVAIDGAGNLYVADYLNDAVKKIKPIGGYYINALPAGFNFDNSTGVLSGTPVLVSPATDYTVTAYNNFGSNSATVNIKVDLLPLPVMNYTNAPKYVINTPITPLVPQSTGVAAPGYTNSPVNFGSGYNNPIGLAAGSNGEVYIADAGNNSVKKIFAGNVNIFSVGSGFNYPSGVATDASGNIYVADQLNNSIKRIAYQNGVTTLIASGFNNPCGVAIDAAGNIYVADKGNNAVKKIPFGGGAAINIGSGFNQPSGVAVDAEGNVYVADYGNNAVKMISVGGGNPVSIGSGFSQPMGVAVDASGNIYIANTGNNTIEKMPAGAGTPVVICSAIIHPTSVAVDIKGIVYATDGGNKVKIISPVGGYYVSPVLPKGLSIDNVTGIITGTPLVEEPGHLYTITGFNNTGSVSKILQLQVNLLPPPLISYSSPQSYTKNVAITSLTPTGSSVSIAGYSSATTSMGIGLALPVGVAVDGAGNVYVADSGTGLVKKIQKVGGGTVSIGSGFNTPSSVAVDGAANVYVSDSGNNTVFKIPADGSATVTIGTGFSSPSGVAVDSLGNVYVADKGNHAVKKIPAGGGAVITIGSGFTNPVSVAADTYGNIYLADASDNVIKKIPAGGGNAVIVASGFNQPIGVSVDASGNLFVSNFTNNIVNMVPAGGGAMTVVGSGFNHPYSVAIDASGSVYVADYLNNIIKKTIPVGGFYIKPSLPAGLIFNSNTGVISGTPTAVSSASDYEVTGYNIYGTASAKVNIVVNLMPPPSVSYNTPQVYVTGIAITPLAPTSTGIAAPAFSNLPYILNSGGKPKGIATDAAGNVYIADGIANVINKIPVNGGPVVTLASGFFGINTVAVDAAGNVYAGDYTATTLKMLPVGGGPLVNVGSDFTNPTGITFDAAGNIYVADQSQNAVYKLPAGGGAMITLALAIGNPSSIAIDAAGNLYVTCPSINAVKKIPADGGPIVTIGAGFNQPYGVAVDNLGNVFVADFSNTVKMIPSDGGATISVSSGYTHPTGVALDISGNLYIADVIGNVKLVKRAGGYYINPALPDGLAFDNNTGIISGTPLTVSPAKNYIATAYNGSGGTPATISIKVNAGPGNSTLSNVAVSTGSFAPAFTSAQTSYTMNLPNATSSIKITPTSSNPAATIKVNGIAVNTGVASASIPLVVGLNTVTIAVTSQDGTATKNYTIQITRAMSPNAVLTLIKVTPFTSLILGSGPDYRNYTTNVPNSQTSLQVTATTQDATAIITVNGIAVASGTASQVIPLNIGSNVINTVVTAQDGVTTKAYVITATRATSAIATLNALTLSGASLTPVFAPGTTSYTASVANTVTTINITPTATNADATIKVNGTAVSSGVTSAGIPLVVGLNTVTIAVTSQDGTATKTYTVKITRAMSSNAVLTLIKVTPFTSLVLGSGPDYRDYTTNVPNSQTSLQVTATTQDAAATITVNGIAVASGIASQVIPLSVGSNVISTVVTAQDGVTTKAYVITATRAPSAVATLNALTLSGASLTPVFAPGTTSYTASVANTVTTINITPTATNAGATITVNGTAVSSGTTSAGIPLVVGLNTVTIAVTSQDGTATKTYTVKITRAMPSNAVLTLIKVTPFTSLVLGSGPDYRNYTTNVPNSQTSLQVTATTQDAIATITVNGIAVASGAASQVIPLSVGSNVISTVVTAQDGVTTKTYTITAIRAIGVLSMTKAFQNPESFETKSNDIVVHQALSPNGDGISDVLTIDGISQHPDNKLQVINSSGALIYSAKGYDNFSKVFNGRSNINGKLQQAGTYFYQLEYNDRGKIKRKTGFILIKY